MGLKRKLNVREEVTTLAVGTSDPDTGLFTLHLSEPVVVGYGEELTLEVNTCRVPSQKTVEPPAAPKSPQPCPSPLPPPPANPDPNMWFQWSMRYDGTDYPDAKVAIVPWRDLASTEAFAKRILGDGPLWVYSKCASLLPRASDDTVYVYYRDRYMERYVKRMLLAHHNLPYSATKTFDVHFTVSPALQDILNLLTNPENMDFRIPAMPNLSTTYPPPVVPDVTVPDPPVAPDPYHHHVSASIMIDGVEPCRFQGTTRKPYVDSVRLDSFGGVTMPRPYVTPLDWRGPMGATRTITAWVEDDCGDRLLFPPCAPMVAEITWRVWNTANTYLQDDDLTGTVVVTFDGADGMWDMGGTRDWTGISREGSDPTYEVAVLAAALTGTHTGSALGVTVTAPDWLGRGEEGNLAVIPGPGHAVPAMVHEDDDDATVVDPNETPPGSPTPSTPGLGPGFHEDVPFFQDTESAVTMFVPMVPRFKRIRAVCAAQTRFCLRPLNIDPNHPYIIHRTKLVLSVRQCPDTRSVAE